MWLTRQDSESMESIVEKQENAGYDFLLFFFQCFQKACFSDS